MPTINIPDKVCPHCNGTIWYLKKILKKGKPLVVHYCNNKRIDTENRRRIINREKMNIYYKKWHENNPGKASEATKKYMSKNKDKVNTYVKKKRKDLSDYVVKEYVAQLINRQMGSKIVKVADIPQEIVDTKRKQILLKRQIKQSCLQ